MKTITNTFVLVAPDCPVTVAVPPDARGPTPTVPLIQYGLLVAHRYALTLRELIYETHVRRMGVAPAVAAADRAAIEAELFRRPVACMRASALPKRYGWGVHYDAAGHLALHAVESAEYRRFAAGRVSGVELTTALRSKRG